MFYLKLRPHLLPVKTAYGAKAGSGKPLQGRVYEFTP
jgi:hypothetical protein